MAKKYKKVGQLDVYEPEKSNNGCAQFIVGAIIFFIVLFALSKCS